MSYVNEPKKGNRSVSLRSGKSIAAIRNRRGISSSEMVQSLETRTLLSAATATFNYSSSFPPANMQLNGGALIVSNDLQLTTTGTTSQSRSAYHNAKVAVDKFVTRFVYTPTTLGPDMQGGFTFVMQNQALSAVGTASSSGTNYGYNGIDKSVAIRMDLSGAGGPLTAASQALLSDSTTGSFTSHRNTVMKPEIHQFVAGHAYEFVISYSTSDKVLKMIMTDRTTKETTYQHYDYFVVGGTEVAVDIPAAIGGTTAWVGFTGSTGSAADAHSVQTITEWVYYSGISELPPIAQFTANYVAPYQALAGDFIFARTGTTVALDASSSYDIDGPVSTYQWDYSYDGTTFNVEGTGQQVNRTLGTATTNVVALRVLDSGSNDSANIQILNIKTDNNLDAVITPNRTSGVGPLSVHFDASRTLGLSSADLVNARFKWEFDVNNADGSGVYEAGEGMVASHVFEAPGTYTVRLTVTDVAGYSNSDTATITVSAGTWTTYYFATNGNDNNLGTIGSPKLNLSTAFGLAGPNVRVLLRKGDTWLVPAGLTTWAAGPFAVDSYSDPLRPSSVPPILKVNYSASGGYLLNLNGTDTRVMNITIEGNGDFPGGANLAGTNNMLYRSTISDVGGNVAPVNGLYGTVFGNTATVNAGPYGVYGSGPRGVAVIGNNFVIGHPSTHEHVVRFQGGNRIYIAHNTLGGAATKSNIQIRGNSSLAVIYDNKVIGRDSGANPQNDQNEEYMHHVVWDSNRFDYNGAYAYPEDSYSLADTAINVQGARHVVLRNNLMVNYLRLFDIRGHVLSGETRDVHVYNNTVVNDGTRDTQVGALGKIGGGRNIVVVNNLSYAKGAAPLSTFASLYVTSDMGTALIADYNLFYGVNWGTANAYKIGATNMTLAQWRVEQYGAHDIFGQNPVLVSDVPTNADFMKLQATSPALNVGAAVPVYIDRIGTARPQGAAIDIGAYERGATATAPNAPSNLGATVISSSQINLAWADNSDNETGFKIDRATNSAFTTGLTTYTVGVGVVSYNNTGLTSATTYYYRVYAYNAQGNSSESNTVNATTLPTVPAAPTGLTATTASPSQINLAWTDTSNNETGFKVQRATNSSFSAGLTTFTLGSGATSYSATGLSPSTTYYFRVYSTNLAGDSLASNTASATTAAASYGVFTNAMDIGSPSPAGSANYASGTYTVTAGGTDIWSGSDQFHYLHKSFSGDGVIVARVATVQNTNAYAKAGIMFRDSTAANAMHAMVSVSPTSGIGFQYRSSTGAAAIATWSTGIGAPRWIKLVRAGNSFSGYQSADGIAWTQVGTTQTVAMASAATAGLALTSHASGTLNTSTFTNVSLGLPAAPSGLSAVRSSTAPASAIDLAWIDNADNETGFSLERDTDVGFTSPTTLTIASPNTTSYSDTGLAEWTRYYYRVRAVNASGDSPWSSVVSAETVGVPAAPTDLTSVAVSGSQIDLAWSDNSGTELGYIVERSTNAFDFSLLASLPSDSESYQDSGLSSSTMYWYRIYAYNAQGNSSYSSTVSATTQASAGNGLRGEYYDNSDLTSLKLTRTDASVNFLWGTGSPDPLLAVETFSVRWTGQVQAQYSEMYTFYTSTDDGVRLWVDGVPLVDDWTNHGETERSGSIALIAGQKYNIKLEYYDNINTATAKLSWSSASTPKAIVPGGQLFSSVNLAPTDDAYVRDGGYSDDNFGSDPYIYAKSSNSGYTRQSYITFDLTQLGSISEATLRLYGGLHDVGSLDVSLYEVTDTSWNENTLTWDAKPANNSTALATVTISSTALQWYEWDISTWLQAQKSAGKTTVSLLLKSDTPMTNAYAMFNSIQALTDVPQLIVSA